MDSQQIGEAYRQRHWRFLADLQKKAGMEFVVGRREGSHIWNVENSRRLLDCGNSGGVHSLGHCNPEIRQLIAESLETLDAGMWVMPTEEALAFQDTVNRADSPIPDCRTVLTLSASDAMDATIMWSFRVTGRKKVLAFKHGYHGHSGFAALATGSEAEGLLSHYSLPGDYSLFFEDYGDLDAIERTIDASCAAIIMEPMNYETFEPAPDGFLEGVQALCRRHSTLLILDETRSGLGRSGRLWMSGFYDIQPDIIISGKGLGGGYYPVGALIARSDIYDLCMNSGHWGYMASLAGSPIGARIAMKVLDIVRRPELVANVHLLERDLTTLFLALSANFPDLYRPAWVRGGIAALGLQDAQFASMIQLELFRRGVLCHSTSLITPSVVKFFPCLTSTPSIVEELGGALEDCAQSFRKQERVSTS
ncbi:aspartate aminotransferase family protein [Beijerinckia indica]|uniref:Aminotransferase class-III n=1 Tax=Beijerinckia indica subsp. indica (strain ATCC 9039 / DSM 1715 / NCIMB 8712) TaxID=395963 RepID=B2IBQ3_BEII9|nr:aminotransferase class III-fold pyridoxal phosphate-dependent enzyme [Beijerinckia indica]ACB93775.1 aminotransferase class-III [Beijerinckia indica subsp. indica ATCC 9039]